MTLLTVATLNLRHTADRWLRRRELIVAELLDVRPDLIAFQEVALLIRQGSWLRHQINYRLTRTAQQPYWLYIARRGGLTGLVEGVGILGRLPLVAADRCVLSAGRVAARVNVLLPSGATLDFVSVHLHGRPAEPEVREEQVWQLLSWLNGPTAAPLQIVAGCFREMPSGAAIRQMKQVYHSTFVLAQGREPLATFPTALNPVTAVGVCHDYIFVSPPLAQQVRQAQLFCRRPAEGDDTLYPSDHVGLLAQLDTPSAGVA